MADADLVASRRNETLAAVDDALLRAIEEGVPKNTRRTYASAWRSWSEWCAACGLDPLEGDPRQVARYLVVLVEHRGLRTVSLEVHLAAIANFWQARGLPKPSESSLIRATMRGLRRQHAMRPDRADPLLPEHLAKIRAAMAEWPTSGRSPKWKVHRDWALISVGWAGGFRRSEIVGLTEAHVDMSPDGLRVYLGRSKTDQEGRGHLRGLPRVAGHALCPVAALEALHTVSPWKGDQRVFRLRSGHAATLVVQRWCERAGLEGAYSAHSLRAGFATAAAQAGVEERRWMAHANWSSLRVARTYVREGELFLHNPLKKILQ